MIAPGRKRPPRRARAAYGLINWAGHQTQLRCVEEAGRSGASPAQPRLLRRHNLSTVVVAARGAHPVRQPGAVTLGAFGKRKSPDGVVRRASALTLLGVLFLG